MVTGAIQGKLILPSANVFVLVFLWCGVVAVGQARVCMKYWTWH